MTCLTAPTTDVNQASRSNPQPCIAGQHNFSQVKEYNCTTESKPLMPCTSAHAREVGQHGECSWSFSNMICINGPHTTDTSGCKQGLAIQSRQTARIETNSLAGSKLTDAKPPSAAATLMTEGQTPHESGATRPQGRGRAKKGPPQDGSVRLRSHAWPGLPPAGLCSGPAQAVGRHLPPSRTQAAGVGHTPPA